MQQYITDFGKFKLNEESEETKGLHDEEKSDDLKSDATKDEDKGDKKVDWENNKELKKHYDGAIKNVNDRIKKLEDEIKDLKKDKKYDKKKEK